MVTVGVVDQIYLKPSPYFSEIGVMGTKTLCVSLLSNTTLESLDLDDNGIENQGCAYLADMLRENYFITELVNNHVRIVSNL